MKRRKGYQVEYQGKKYDSLSELSEGLSLLTDFSDASQVGVLTGGKDIAIIDELTIEKVAIFIL